MTNATNSGGKQVENKRGKLWRETTGGWACHECGKLWRGKQAVNNDLDIVTQLLTVGQRTPTLSPEVTVYVRNRFPRQYSFEGGDGSQLKTGVRALSDTAAHEEVLGICRSRVISGRSQYIPVR